MRWDGRRERSTRHATRADHNLALVLLCAGRAKRLAGVVLASLVVAGGIGGWLWYRTWATPEAAPHFNLLASTGKRIALTDYVGKQEVVLLFYMGVG